MLWTADPHLHMSDLLESYLKGTVVNPNEVYRLGNGEALEHLRTAGPTPQSLGFPSPIISGSGACAPNLSKRVLDAASIELCVRRYITVRLSYRDVTEMMAKHAVTAVHSTILRWVTRYVPEFEKRWNRFSRAVGTSWPAEQILCRVYRTACHRPHRVARVNSQ
jgi:hypothetical protein